MLHVTSLLSILSQGGISLVQALGASFGRLSANFMVGGVVTGMLLVATITYIIVNISINKLKKGAYEIWLSETPWGVGKNRAEWSTKSGLLESARENQQVVSEAIAKLETIVKQPTISHEVIEKVTAYPQYTHKETLGIKLNIQVPEQATGLPIRLKSNLETLDESAKIARSENGYFVDVSTKELPQYLSINLEYQLGDEQGKNHAYWFQHAVKQSASYSSIIDTDKQKKIDASITSDWLVL